MNDINETPFCDTARQWQWIKKQWCMEWNIITYFFLSSCFCVVLPNSLCHLSKSLFFFCMCVYDWNIRTSTQGNKEYPSRNVQKHRALCMILFKCKTKTFYVSFFRLFKRSKVKESVRVAVGFFWFPIVTYVINTKAIKFNMLWLRIMSLTIL